MFCFPCARRAFVPMVMSRWRVLSAISTACSPTPLLTSNRKSLIWFVCSLRCEAACRLTARAWQSHEEKWAHSLLRMLVDDNQLMWTNSYTDMAKGLIFPLKSAQTQSAALSWRDEDGMFKLAWQFDTSQQADESESRTTSANGVIDYILPTQPAWYVNNLSCGELNLQQPDSAISIRDLQEIVAQGTLAGARRNHVCVSPSHGQWFKPDCPTARAHQRSLDRRHQALYHASPWGSAPQPTRYGQRWFDYALLSFDYDDINVPLTQTMPVVR